MTTSLAIAGVACTADLAGLEIDLLAGAEDDAFFQVDDAVLAEAGDRRAVLRVERDQPIAGRDVEDALVAAAVGPVREAAARELTRRDAGALAFAQAVRPDQLAGLRRRARRPSAACRRSHRGRR